MQLSVSVRITVVICATLIVLGIVAALVITGSPVDAWAILTGAGVLLGGLLYGVGAAGGPVAIPLNGIPFVPSPSRSPLGSAPPNQLPPSK